MSNIDAFDRAIAAHLASIEKMRQQISVAEAELRGMLKMRDLLNTQGQANGNSPSPVASKPTNWPLREKSMSEGGYRGGRQPGAISTTWRKILSDLYWLSGQGACKFGNDEIISVALDHGITLRPSEADSRMRHYVQFGYTQVFDDGVLITDAAAKKFGFDKEPLTNEAPNADASEPQ